MSISIFRDDSDANILTELIGGSDSPALITGVDIEISVYDRATDEVQLVISGGGTATPALFAGGNVRMDEKVYHAGADEDHFALVGK